MNYKIGNFIKNERTSTLFKILEISKTPENHTRLVLANAQTIDPTVSVKIMYGTNRDTSFLEADPEDYSGVRMRQRNGKHGWRNPHHLHKELPKGEEVGLFYDWTLFDTNPDVVSPALHSNFSFKTKFIDPINRELSSLESGLACLLENKSGSEILEIFSSSDTSSTIKEILCLRKELDQMLAKLSLLKKINKSI